MNQLRVIIGESSPENIPNQFIVGARVTTADGDILDMTAEELKTFIGGNQGGNYRVNLATDIRAMSNYINNVVSELVDRISNQPV